MPWTAAHQASLSITNSWSLVKLMSIELVIPSNHLILCHPLLLPPSVFPSIRVFSSESVLCIRWPKYWSFSFNISPSSEYSGLISFIVQLSYPYLTTGKTIALTRQTFVGKVMSLLFNMLSRLVIPFLPRSKRLLISWLRSPSAVILEPPKIKSLTVSTVSASICHEVMGPDAMILVFWMLSFKPTFSLTSFTFIKRLFSSSSLSAIRVVSSAYLRFLIPPYFVRYFHIGLSWWLSDKESACQCRRPGFNPWVGKIPWVRKWQPTLVFLPGKSHGQRSLTDYNWWGCERVRHNLATKQQQLPYYLILIVTLQRWCYFIVSILQIKETWDQECYFSHRWPFLIHGAISISVIFL